MSKIGIIGLGEIGSSLFNIYKQSGIKVYTRDIDSNINCDIDILNICIPGGLDNFIDIVKEYRDLYNSKLVIIHSTVPIGTTRKIDKAVHSPVRGIHPNLAEGIKTFVKFIGYNNDTDRDMCIEHYDQLGIKHHAIKSSEASELAKLTSTTYYGLCIAWHGEMKKICESAGISFDEAVTTFNKTYNEGYKALDKPEVIRPVLYPPEGVIGGHCILPNVEILKRHSSSSAYELIEQYKKEK